MNWGEPLFERTKRAQIETMRAFVTAGWGVSVVPQMACAAKDDGGAVRFAR